MIRRTIHRPIAATSAACVGAVVATSAAAYAAVYKAYGERVLRSSSSQCMAPLAVMSPQAVLAEKAAMALAKANATLKSPQKSSGGNAGEAKAETADAVAGTGSAATNGGPAVTASFASNPLVDANHRRIVLISGWGGALPRQVQSLREWYAERGYDTVVVLPSMLNWVESETFVGVAAEACMVLHNHIKGLMETKEEKKTRPPLQISFFIHSHSNTSHMYLLPLLQCMHQHRALFDGTLLRCYKGTVWDSHPGQLALRREVLVPKHFEQWVAKHQAERPLEPLPMRFAEEGEVKEESGSSSSTVSVSRWYRRNYFDFSSFSSLRNHNPLSWAAYSAMLAVVATPTLARRNTLLHWYWTPVAFLCIHKDLWHTALRRWRYDYHHCSRQRGQQQEEEGEKGRCHREGSCAVPPTPLGTRFLPFLSPSIEPSMRALADAYADAVVMAKANATTMQRTATPTTATNIDAMNINIHSKAAIAERTYASLSALRNHDEFMGLDVFGTTTATAKMVGRGRGTVANNNGGGDDTVDEWLMPLVNYRRCSSSSSAVDAADSAVGAQREAAQSSSNKDGTADSTTPTAAATKANRKTVAMNTCASFNDPFNRRHLFLYSKADVLINYHDVQRYMYALWRSERDGWEALGLLEEEEEARARARGREAQPPSSAPSPSSSQIYSHVFEKTPHVSHFRRDTANYTRQLENFLGH